MSQKVNVYVVASGDYDDYHIERVFLNLEDAEYYVAEQTDKRKNDPNADVPSIEIWNVSKMDKKKKVYKAIFFQASNRRILSWQMIYSLTPFQVDVVRDRELPGSTTSKKYYISGISGVIPTDITFYNDSIDDETIVKKMIQSALTDLEENLL